MNNFTQFLNENAKLTLEYHDELNSKFWTGETLKPEVRKHLLMVANKWAVFSNIPKSGIKDVVLTGGNANFNYTKFSDLDVHLIVDFSSVVDCKTEFVDEYLRDKKTIWQLTHDIKIYGAPVEVYAEEQVPSRKSQGVYSLTNDSWHKKPKKEKVDLQDALLKSKIDHHVHMIDYALKYHADEEGTLAKIKERIRNMRGSAVRKAGEFSVENLVFKELRNRGILDKMSKHIRELQDTKLSLTNKKIKK